MKKNKFIRISILALVLAILMFGVYAVSKTAVLNTNGTVGFIAHDCELSVYGTVTGAVSDPNNMDQNLEQTFYFGNEENQFIIKDETVLTFAESLSNEDLSVKYPSIYFNDAKDEVPNIVFEFHITNLSKYSVKMEITNVINSDKISVIDDTRLKCVIDDWTGLVLIELQLDDYESNIVDLNNFNLVMEFTKRDESEGLSYSPIYETETATSAGLFSAKALNQSEDNIIGYAVSGMGSCEDTNLVIPGRYNGKLVKEIADYAFSGATITSLELPPSIERIGMGAFMSCKSLTKVALPYSLNEIGQQGFEDCSNLTDVEFGDTTTASGVAYDYGSDGTNADDNDNGNNNSPSTPSLKGLNILNNAFANCVKLPNIKLPSFTLNIGESAFLNNVALKAVDLGNKLTEIGLNAFGGCNALPEVKFPQSLEKIYNVAINGVVKITDVAIDGVQFVLDKTIPQIADASNPQNPSEPSNPDDSGNSGSGSGDNTGSGGDNTGSGSGDGSGDSTQEEVAVTKDLFTGLSIISLEIPYGVTRIDAYAFANCESLKEIYLPITLKYIGEYAFSNCVNLENIIIYKNVEYMGENVFDGCDGLKAIYCKMNEEPSTWETNWVGDNYAKVYFNGVLKYYKSKLMTPKNIEINPFDFTINFTESVNASYYEIYLYSNGSLCNTVKITKSGDKIINDLIALGTYDVSICAIGDGKMFTNSEVASAGKLNYTSSELNYTKAFNYNGHTYQLFITNDYNWTQINAFCEYKGGHLVTVTSEAEKQAIYNETSSYYSVIETVEWSSLAMGLYKENGNWKWVTGEPYSYSSWQPGEPTNDGNYGYYVITKNGNWHDYGANCDSGLGNFIVGFILEFDEIIECEEFSYAKKLDYACSSYYLYVFDHTKVYSQAKEFCENNGGHLLTVTNPAENQIIYNTFYKFTNILTKKGVYMDATDVSSEGSWKWATGEMWGYSNWDESQPDNAFDGAEDYLEYILSTSKWNDIRPTIEYSMIIMEVDHETTARAVSSTEFNGHKYVFYVSDLNWDEAKEYCENMGGHLATITSQEEQNALNVAYNLIYKTNNIWFLFQIGASDVNQEGVWEWITGEPFNYTNFMDGQPNYTTIENYLSMGTQWNDIGLDITLLPKTVYGFILEIE